MIRYALMFADRNYTEWKAQCIDALLAVEGAAVVAVIRPHKGSGDTGPKHSSGGAAWKLLRKAELFVHRPRAWLPRDLPEQVASVPEVDCTFVPNDTFGFRIAEDDLRAIEALDLDFILAFLDYNILRGPVLEAPRYGIWSFHHGDPVRYRGAPPAVWEIYDGAPRTGAVLQRLTDRLDAGIILRRNDYPTVRHSFYWSSDNIHFKAAPWPAEICRELVAGDVELLSGPPLTTDAPIRRAPNNRQALRLGLVLLWNNLAWIAGAWRRR